MWHRVQTNSIQRHEVVTWLEDSDKSRVLIGLLNKELEFMARRIGLLKTEGEDRYFFPSEGDYRQVLWKPRFKESSKLTVAKKTYFPKLKRTVYVHYAVKAGFCTFGKDIYLGLHPTLILTEDGRSVTAGEREGAVLTSLLSAKYNQIYLNELLFWAQQFAVGTERIELAHGRVQISIHPVDASVSVGIVADRPVSEGMPETTYTGVEP